VSGVAAAGRVLDIEATAPLPAIPAPRWPGPGGARAWLLVRVDREPVGALMVELPGDGLPAAAVGEIVEAALGERIRRASRSAGLVARQREEAIAAGPELTVVVCTRDRPAALARCLDSILAQRYRRFRVLVVDNAPEGGATAEAVRAVGRPELVERIVAPVSGLSHARNAAVAATRGETLAWIDDDEVADPFWLCGIARALLAHPGAGIVSGPVAPAELQTPAQVWFEQFGGHSKGRDFTPAVFSPDTAAAQSPLYPLPPFGAGANLATRPGVIESIGGFDTALGAGTRSMGGEDTLALTQVLLDGGTIVYQPSALVWHYHRRDLAGLHRQLYGYGTGLTAAYTALLLRRPGVLPGLVRLAPTALRDLAGGGASARTATIGPDFPRALLRANLRGMVYGPVTYLAGRRRGHRAPVARPRMRGADQLT
jgi:GT2 family glycosyltransferase